MNYECLLNIVIEHNYFNFLNGVNDINIIVIHIFLVHLSSYECHNLLLHV